MTAKPFDATDPDAFIEHWSGVPGSELSNAQPFVIGLCALLGVPEPHATEARDYMFERPVTFRAGNGATSPGRIDCYRRGCFVLEAKKLKVSPGGTAAPARANMGTAPLTAKEKAICEKGPAAVLDAYGWQNDPEVERSLERLIALNAESAAEEAQGQVRWLRPAFQHPGATQAALPVAAANTRDAPGTPDAAPVAWTTGDGWAEPG